MDINTGEILDVVLRKARVRASRETFIRTERESDSVAVSSNSEVLAAPRKERNKARCVGTFEAREIIPRGSAARINQDPGTTGSYSAHSARARARAPPQLRDYT